MTDEYIVLTEDRNITYSVFVLQKTAVIFISQPFFNDEELIAVIKKIAVQLNHSPARKEVFWPFRDYVKRRFRRWPYVMERAGLSRSAGKGGPPVNKGEVIK